MFTLEHISIMFLKGPVVNETLDQFVVLQRDKETVGGSGVHTDQDQNQNQDRNQGLQDQTLQNQELQAIRAELKQLRTLVQQLVENNTEDNK